MRTITPTGFGETGPAPRQLGSTAEVVRALPAGSTILIRTSADSADIIAALRAQGREPDEIKHLRVSHGPEFIRHLNPDQTIGVAKDAFFGMIPPMYEAMHAILASGRFTKVIWA